MDFADCPFRIQVILSTLSGKALKLKKIRSTDEEPGLTDYEVDLLKLIDLVTNGTRVDINETGTSLYYVPGMLIGARLESLNPGDDEKYAYAYKVSKRKIVEKYNKIMDVAEYISITILDTLPSEVLISILDYLDHNSLVNLGIAFQKYISLVTNPKYWSSINLPIDSEIINTYEFNLFAMNYGQSTKQMNLNIDSFNNDELCVQEIFQLFNNLEILSIKSSHPFTLVENLAEKFIQLQFLNISCKNLTDAHIILLTDSLKLISLNIKCQNDLSPGLEYYLQNSRKVVGFGFHMPLPRKNLIDIIVRYHKDTIQQLKFAVKGGQIALNFDLKKIEELLNLVQLDLYHVEPMSMLNETLDKLDKLESFNLRNYGNSYLQVKNTAIFFSKQRPKMYELRISGMSISKKGLKLIGLCCPNLKLLSLRSCEYMEETMVLALTGLKNLSVLHFNQKFKQKLYQFNYRYLIHNGYLKNLKHFFLHLEVEYKGQFVLDMIVSNIFMQFRNLKVNHCVSFANKNRTHFISI